MPALKPLSRVIEWFAKSVNNTELPEEIRSFAAKLMTLTAHVVRVEGRVDLVAKQAAGRIKQLEQQISSMADIVALLAQQSGVAPAQQEQGATPAPSAPSAPPTQTAPAAPQVAAVPEETEEEDEGDAAMQARLLAETAAEVEAINQAAANGAK